MDAFTWGEIIAWWAIALDCITYNVIAWGGERWYKLKFPNLARLFPVTKAFGLLYGGLAVWVGTALVRAGLPLFGQ